jgi:hypothetical protein
VTEKAVATKAPTPLASGQGKSKYKDLRRLLKKLPPKYRPVSLNEIARACSLNWIPTEHFEPVGYHFCDGFEICVGTVPVQTVKDSWPFLRNDLAYHVPDLRVQFIQASQR